MSASVVPRPWFREKDDPPFDNKIADRPQNKGDLRYNEQEVEGMPPRSSASDDRISEALALLAEAIASDRAKKSSWLGMWMPTLLTVGILGTSLIRFDTSREGEFKHSTAVMQAKIEMLEKTIDDQKRIFEREQRLRADYEKRLGIILNRRGIPTPDSPLPYGGSNQ